MRSATSAEAEVVASLLAGATDGGRFRALPRRTRQTVVQRIYLQEWIVDRFVPDLGALDAPILTFALAQPFLEESARTLQRWRDGPEAVHLWAGPEAAFGVFVTSPGAALRALRERIAPPGAHRAEIVLSVDTREATVPVYMDFEAAWTRTTGSDETLSYPTPFPAGSRSEKPGGLLGAPRIAMLRLLRQPTLSGGTLRLLPRSPGVLGERWERRSLRQGHVRLRSFLDPLAVARSLSGFPQEIVFLHGRLRTGRVPEGLFRALVTEGNLRPFLFATDLRTVLIGHLAHGRDAPASPAGGSPVPLSDILRPWLEGISVVREVSERLEALINHRYDRPFLTDPGRASVEGVPRAEPLNGGPALPPVTRAPPGPARASTARRS